jgi:transcriptional regulator of arginine metabolism
MGILCHRERLVSKKIMRDLCIFLHNYAFMKITTKRKLASVLRGLLADGFEGTQSDLCSALQSHGFDVTQSTISRVLKNLGVVKISEKGRTIYRPPLDTPRAALNHGLAPLVQSVQRNETMIIIKTAPGSAMLVAGFIDHHCADDVLGTVAGDDTLFVAPKSVKNIEGHMAGLVEFLK